jgi:hypothetical protein
LLLTGGPSSGMTTLKRISSGFKKPSLFSPFF